MLRQMVNGMSAEISHVGGSSVPYSILQARRMIYQTVLNQAQMLSYIDVFWLLSIGCCAMIPLLFLMKPNRPGGAPAAH